MKTGNNVSRRFTDIADSDALQPIPRKHTRFLPLPMRRINFYLGGHRWKRSFSLFPEVRPGCVPLSRRYL